MERGSTKSALRQIRTLYELGTLGGLTDGQLLELFLTRSGADAEDAFAALVHRHGPMVLGVCRRMLSSSHDAEDAFQATFLILARRAAAIGRQERLANWLYGVAVRTAKEGRRRAAREQARERRAMERTHVESEPAGEWDDLAAILDEELSRLPDRYRTALVTCELEGKSRREAAQQLGLSEGTLSTHLRAAESCCASASSNAESASGLGPGRDCRKAPSRPRCRTGCSVPRSTRRWDMRPTGSHRGPFPQPSRRWPKECSR